MVIVKCTEKPYSTKIQKMYGLTGQLGWNKMGFFALGLLNEGAGIYQIKTQDGHQITSREKFYMQWKPRTPNQNTAALKWKNGMIAWSNLTEEEKAVYNTNAKKYRIEGVNLFMRNWMLTP